MTSGLSSTTDPQGTFYIGFNLAEIRKGKKMMQDQVAQEVGVTRAAVARWEAGFGVPSVQNCIKIAQVLDVSLDRLVTHPGLEIEWVRRG